MNSENGLNLDFRCVSDSSPSEIAYSGFVTTSDQLSSFPYPTKRNTNIRHYLDCQWQRSRKSILNWICNGLIRNPMFGWSRIDETPRTLLFFNYIEYGRDNLESIVKDRYVLSEQQLCGSSSRGIFQGMHSWVFPETWTQWLDEGCW